MSTDVEVDSCEGYAKCFSYLKSARAPTCSCGAASYTPEDSTQIEAETQCP